jgi:hypothetical protein
MNHAAANDGVIESKEVMQMKMQEVRKVAMFWGVDAKIGRFKEEIIRDIQLKEGNSPCFGTKETCDNDCLWKADCLSAKR